MDIFKNLVPVFSCPICHALSSRRALCESCRERLWQWREPIVRHDGDLTARSLFSWRKDDWLGLRWWAKGLKYKEQLAFWREPALWMLKEYGQRHNPVLIPIPSRSEHNHARGFARALSHFTGWTIEERLEFVDSSAQKRLSRRARQFRRFKGVGLTGDWSKYTAVILVDDIITTGATARAAYQALGSPNSTEVWCLLDRRPCDPFAALL